MSSEQWDFDKVPGGNQLARVGRQEISIDQWVPDLARLSSEELFLAQPAKTCELVCSVPAADSAREILHRTRIVRQILHLRSGRSATFQNRCSVEPIVAAVVAEELVCNALCSCALAPNGDTIRVTTESSNVLLNPTKRHPLIEETSITRSFSKKLGCLHKAVHVETVVHRHSDDRLAHILTDFDDAGEIVLRISYRAGVEATAKYPDKHRERMCEVAGRSNNVEVQTVLGHVEVASKLHAAVSLLRSIADF